MNIALQKGYLAVIFSLICIPIGFSQARFNIKTGVETWSIKDEKDLSGESHHSGQTLGFDMHIMSNRFIFAPGFHYHRISVLNRQEGFQFNFQKGNHLHYFSIPLTFGYKIFNFKVVDISFMAGAESIFFFNLDSNDIDLKVDDLYGVTPSLTGVVHANVLTFLTADFKYHHALHELIRKRPDSLLSGFSFEVGVIF